MKKFIVVEKTECCEFTIEKSFTDLEDTITYKKLLEKANEFETTKYYITAIL